MCDTGIPQPLEKLEFHTCEILEFHNRVKHWKMININCQFVTSMRLRIPASFALFNSFFVNSNPLSRKVHNGKIKIISFVLP
jgi:hypothetical protein